MEQTQAESAEMKCSAMLFSNKRFAFLWLLVRLYVGYEWIIAGWGKVTSAAWVGSGAGGALTGFLNGSLSKTGGAHPDVPGWYGYLIAHVALPHAYFFSHLVAFSEVAIGAALILGLFTGVAAFFGAFMNFNFLLAGTVSINPMMFLAQVLLVLAGKIAGALGLDRFILPKVASCCKKREEPKAV